MNLLDVLATAAMTHSGLGLGLGLGVYTDGNPHDPRRGTAAGAAGGGH